MRLFLCTTVLSTVLLGAFAYPADLSVPQTQAQKLGGGEKQPKQHLFGVGIDLNLSKNGTLFPSPAFINTSASYGSGIGAGGNFLVPLVPFPLGLLFPHPPLNITVGFNANKNVSAALVASTGNITVEEGSNGWHQDHHGWGWSTTPPPSGWGWSTTAAPNGWSWGPTTQAWSAPTTTEGWTAPPTTEGWTAPPTTEGWTTPGWSPPETTTTGWGWVEPTTSGWGWGKRKGVSPNSNFQIHNPAINKPQSPFAPILVNSFSMPAFVPVIGSGENVKPAVSNNSPANVGGAAQSPLTSELPSVDIPVQADLLQISEATQLFDNQDGGLMSVAIADEEHAPASIPEPEMEILVADVAPAAAPIPEPEMEILVADVAPASAPIPEPEMEILIADVAPASAPVPEPEMEILAADVSSAAAPVPESLVEVSADDAADEIAPSEASFPEAPVETSDVKVNPGSGKNKRHAGVEHSSALRIEDFEDVESPSEMNVPHMEHQEMSKEEMIILAMEQNSRPGFRPSPLRPTLNQLQTMNKPMEMDETDESGSADSASAQGEPETELSYTGERDARDKNRPFGFPKSRPNSDSGLQFGLPHHNSDQVHKEPFHFPIGSSVLGFQVPDIKWSSFTNILQNFLGSRNTKNSMGKSDDDSQKCVDEDEGAVSEVVRAPTVQLGKLCDSNTGVNSCHVACVGSGFESGKCLGPQPTPGCLCTIPNHKELGMMLSTLKKAPVVEHREDLLASDSAPCKKCACAESCKGSGSYTGFCIDKCYCAVPWYTKVA